MNRAEVCAIVVTFHPDEQFACRAQHIAAQVGALILVDNASSARELAMLEALAAGPARALLRNPRNLGIAQALNAGLEQAAALGYRWALLMDQDSVIEEHLVSALLGVLESQPAAVRVAVIGAGYRDPIEQPPATGTAAPVERAWDEVDWVITSGSLVSIEAYRVIGAFREEFFIDYVDLEYCVRARAHGYAVLRARAALMHHVIGAPTQHQLLWARKWTSNHSPDRRYYRARNDTVMLRESGRYRFGSWRLKSFARSVRTCKRVLLYERGKWAKIRAVIQGWWDGIHGRLGVRGG